MTNLSDYFQTIPDFQPGAMQFDGSTGYYKKTYTSSGNETTLVAMFNEEDFTGDVIRYLSIDFGGTYARISLLLISSDYSSLPNRRGKLQMDVQNSSGTTIAKLISYSTFLDGEDHKVYASYNATTGVATFIVDGQDENDTGNADRVAETTGTLQTGASSVFAVGSNQLGASKSAGKISFVGLHNAGLDWQDFMHSNGDPRPINEATWDAFGGTQPLFWNPTGFMENNRGSAGNMQRIGNVVVADNGQCPLVPTYNPAMMRFDGSTGYYSKTGLTTSGNKVSAVFRFKRSSFTGGGYECISTYVGPSASSRLRWQILVFSNDYATSNLQSRIRFFVQDSAGVNICAIFANGYLDGSTHTAVFSFDGDLGTAYLYIDGVNADETGNASRVAPTTGTLGSGATSALNWGSSAGSFYFSGDLGYIGTDDTSLSDWSDFMDAYGNPKELDESTWTEWGAQPLFWNEHGEMTNNLGSAGAMTKNGTIIVGKGGN